MKQVARENILVQCPTSLISHENGKFWKTITDYFRIKTIKRIRAGRIGAHIENIWMLQSKCENNFLSTNLFAANDLLPIHTVAGIIHSELCNLSSAIPHLRSNKKCESTGEKGYIFTLESFQFNLISALKRKLCLFFNTRAYTRLIFNELNDFRQNIDKLWESGFNWSFRLHDIMPILWFATL